MSSGSSVGQRETTAGGELGDWQEEKSVLECNRLMLENELATDVCFQIGSTGASTLVRAHKYVLMSRSPVFLAMFSGGMAESRTNCEPINVPDIDNDTFTDLLRSDSLLLTCS